MHSFNRFGEPVVRLHDHTLSTTPSTTKMSIEHHLQLHDFGKIILKTNSNFTLAPIDDFEAQGFDPAKFAYHYRFRFYIHGNFSIIHHSPGSNTTYQQRSLTIHRKNDDGSYGLVKHHSFQFPRHYLYHDEQSFELPLKKDPPYIVDYLIVLPTCFETPSWMVALNERSRQAAGQLFADNKNKR